MSLNFLVPKKIILLTFIFYIHIPILYNIEMFNWSERKGGKKVCKRMPFLNNNDIVAWNWEASLSKEDGMDGKEEREENYIESLFSVIPRKMEKQKNIAFYS